MSKSGVGKATASRAPSERRKAARKSEAVENGAYPASFSNNGVALAPYAVAGVFAVLGAGLGAYISVLGASLNGESQARRKHEDVVREARGVRLSTIAALQDMVQYARMAAVRAHYNARIWQPSVDVLVSRVTSPGTVVGFERDEWALVANAASEARLGLLRLQSISRNPFISGLDRTNAEVDAEQTEYVATIHDVGERTFRALAAALRKTTEYADELPQTTVADLIDALRSVHGQPLVHVTRQHPEERFVRTQDP
jgi:hypothetical protein